MNNTERIDKLEEETGDITTRVRGLRITLKNLTERLNERIVEIKSLQDRIAAIREEQVGFKKDIDGLHKWKEELKKEMNEVTRRWWSIGQGLTIVIISSAVTLLGLIINYILRKP